MAAPPSGRRPDSGSSVLDNIDSYTNPAHRARSRCLSQVGHGLVTGGLSREFVSRVQNLRGKSYRDFTLCVCVCVFQRWTCDAPEASSRCLRESNKCVHVCVCVSASPSPPHERLARGRGDQVGSPPRATGRTHHDGHVANAPQALSMTMHACAARPGIKTRLAQNTRSNHTLKYQIRQ